MILEAAREHKLVEKEKLEEQMVTKFQKMLEDCTKEEERTPWLIQNGCILWEDMFFSITNKHTPIQRVYFCSKCGTQRTIGFTLANREALLETINAKEVCPCVNDTLEDHIYEIAAEAVQEQM